MVANSTIKKGIILQLLIALSFCAFGQVIITQIPPNPVRFSVDDLWDITIINNDVAKRVYLKGTLKDEFGSEILNSHTTDFELGSGVKRIDKLTARTENTVYNANNHSASIISKFNNLPYGKYTLCVYAYDIENNDLLGESCIEHESQPVTPPMLVLPDYCQEINTKLPLFSWLAPVPEILGQEVFYDFKLAEVMPGQSNEDAIQRNLAIVFAANLTQTNFQYPSTATQLDSNKKYVWQVQAKIKKYKSYEVPDNDNFFQNIGISEAWCFNFSTPEIPEIIVKKENITYAIPKLYEDAEITVTNILYLSYTEKYVAGSINYKVYGKEGNVVDLDMPLQAKKGDNRYDINLKKTGLFKHNQLYKLVIENNNKETFFLNFRYIEK